MSSRHRRFDARGRWALPAVLAMALGCARCRSGKQAQGDSDAPSGPAKQLFWLRNTELLDTPAGRPVRTVVDPVLVELSSGGQVRAASSSSDSFEGYLPSKMLETPTDGEGLALYARKVSDLRLASRSGPVIGRIHPGAFVSVIPANDNSVAIATPGFRNETAEGPRDVVAFVETDNLGHDPVEIVIPPREGRLIKDFPPGIDLYASPTDRATPFAHPLCGDARVLVDGQAVAQISQYHGGVELIGWTASPLAFRRGPIRCSVRNVWRHLGRFVVHTGPTIVDVIDTPSVPDGFVGPDRMDRDELLLRMKKGASIYWLTTTGQDARCFEWKFERIRKDPQRNDTGAALFRGLLNRVEPDTNDGERSTLSFSIAYTESESPGRPELSLGGPHWLSYAKGSRGKMLGGSTCTFQYLFVGTTPDALRLLPGNAPSQDLVAWHPDDEEHWFLTKEACLEGAARATEAIRRDPEGQPPGGVHLDCMENDSAPN